MTRKHTCTHDRKTHKHRSGQLTFLRTDGCPCSHQHSCKQQEVRKTNLLLWTRWQKGKTKISHEEGALNKKKKTTNLQLPVGLRRRSDASETWSQLSTEHPAVDFGAKRSQRPEKETTKVRGEAAPKLKVSERLSVTDGSRLAGNLLHGAKKIRFLHQERNRREFVESWRFSSWREVLKSSWNTWTLLKILCLWCF